MVTSMLALFLLGPVRPKPGSEMGMTADTLYCQVMATVEGKRRCSVRVPEGRSIQTCRGVEDTAVHCEKAGGGQFVAWVVGSEGAKCKISKKRTDWARKVTLVMSDKTPAGAATCDLYVVLR